MKNFADIDDTQSELRRHLVETERLLERAVSRLSGGARHAEIWLMPDLGVPQSVQRMHGGFFTGMLAKWECDEPFVPVDSTVNVCAVGLYRIKGRITDKAEFEERVRRVRKAQSNCSYDWNFNHGNHFITVGEIDSGDELPPGQYLVLHSSACEFKSQCNGLYPTANNWYADQIEMIESDIAGRSLRYLRGAHAERFFKQARLLVEYNRTRLQYFAAAILQGVASEEILYQPHYGMPDPQSVAIGCQWLQRGDSCVLLTAPGQNVFVLKPEWTETNRTTLNGQDCVLMPHGLGITARDKLTISYGPTGLELNGSYFSSTSSLRKRSDLVIRGTPKGITLTIREILKRCPARLQGTLRPIFSYPIM